MPDWRLTRKAEEDLIAIALFGDENFGETQSDAYRNQLKQRFERIGQSPLLYPAVDHIRTGYRRSVCGAHSIYYRVESGGVLIVRILGRQEPRQALDS